MTTQDQRTRRGGGRLDGAVPFGLGLIALGGLLALDNLEVLDAGALLAGWWPVALLVAGLWWLVTGSPVLGGVILVIGALLLASTQELVEVELGRLVFPGLLVVVGGGLLQAGIRVRRARFEVLAARAGGSGSGAPVVGPSATAVFGDARLLVGEDGSDPGRVVVTATSVFGEVSVEVPDGWGIEDRITRILGDVKVPRSQVAYPESPVVVLHGLVLFGDVQVRYVDLAEGGR